MDQYRRLAELLNSLPAKKITLWQGIVKSVEGITCTVTFGKQDVPGVRLRASEADDGGHILIVPAAGTAVTVGSLSGDLSSLVVLKADRIESITVNGGNLGGLINIGALTEKINALVDAFRSTLEEALLADVLAVNKKYKVNISIYVRHKLKILPLFYH